MPCRYDLMFVAALCLVLAAPFAPAAARAAEESFIAGGPVIGFERPPLFAATTDLPTGRDGLRAGIRHWVVADNAR